MRSLTSTRATLRSCTVFFTLSPALKNSPNLAVSVIRLPMEHGVAWRKEQSRARSPNLPWASLHQADQADRPHRSDQTSDLMPHTSYLIPAPSLDLMRTCSRERGPPQPYPTRPPALAGAGGHRWRPTSARPLRSWARPPCLAWRQLRERARAPDCRACPLSRRDTRHAPHEPARRTPRCLARAAPHALKGRVAASHGSRAAT